MNNMNISTIINSRVLLQSTQSILIKEFGVKEPNIKTITNIGFLNNYKLWDENKKHKFLVTIGGPLNYEKTKKYFDSVCIYKNSLNK